MSEDNKINIDGYKKIANRLNVQDVESVTRETTNGVRKEMLKEKEEITL